MQNYLFHQNKLVLELLAVILVHGILKSCTFLPTCPQIEWVLGFSVAVGSLLLSLSVKIVYSSAGREKGVWALMVDSLCVLFC